MRTGAGSRAARPAAASCPPAESWDWAWEAGFPGVPPPDWSATLRSTGFASSAGENCVLSRRGKLKDVKASLPSS